MKSVENRFILMCLGDICKLQLHSVGQRKVYTNYSFLHCDL